MKIRNTNQQLVAAVEQGILKKEQAVTITWLPYVSRQAGGYNWLIYSPYFKTDEHPESTPWYNYGNKTFSPRHFNSKSRMAALEHAKIWCESMYGILVNDWARNSIGDYVPRVVNKAVSIPRREKKDG